MSEVKRATRVAGRLQAGARRRRCAICAIPRLDGVLVSRVEVTDDLQSARVYVRRELGGDPAAVKAALKGLGQRPERLRRAAAQALGLRYVPTLRFFYDEAPDAVRASRSCLIEVKKGSG